MSAIISISSNKTHRVVSIISANIGSGFVGEEVDGVIVSISGNNTDAVCITVSPAEMEERA